MDLSRLRALPSTLVDPISRTLQTARETRQELVVIAGPTVFKVLRLLLKDGCAKWVFAVSGRAE